MARALLVTDAGLPTGALREALAGLGYETLSLASPHALAQSIGREQPDIVLVDAGEPPRELLEQLAVAQAERPRPVLVFCRTAEQQQIRHALDAGVTTYLTEVPTPERLVSLLGIAQAQFAHEADLRQRLAQAEGELAERRWVDQAKRLLMDRHGLSEPGAYALLRKRAMDQGVKLAEAARRLLAAVSA